MHPTATVHNFGTYFITANCDQRRRVFQVEGSAELLHQVLQHYRTQYKLHAFVIMPDHMHLILTPAIQTLERSMQLIKGGFSHRYHAELGRRGSVWQKGYADHRIRDRSEFDRYKHYLEQNPVVLGLVSEATAFSWSSASAVLRQQSSLGG